MVPSQTVSLAQQIERGQAANQQKIAAEIRIPEQDIDRGRVTLRHFSAWCNSRGVKSSALRPHDGCGIRSKRGRHRRVAGTDI